MSFAYSEGNPVEDTSKHGKPPFDTGRLDRLMEEAGLDALLVTSKHSIQYLLGGYRFFFYDYMDAHGLSRYLPFFVYVKGRPLDSGYVGAPMERYEKQLGSFWVTNLDLKNDSSPGYAAAAAEILKRVGGARGPGRHRGRVHAGRCVPGPRGAAPRGRADRRHLHARAPARAQDAGGAGDPQGGVREGRRLDARRLLRATAPGPAS